MTDLDAVRPDPLDTIRRDGLVPLYSSSDADVLYRITVALAAANVSSFEVTLRSPGVREALADCIARSAAAGLPVSIGAGTVLDPVDAEAAIRTGARFVFSPSLVPAIAEVCRQATVPYIPGCATPTEIHAALQLGCTMVKLFPADAIGGPAFLRSVRAVFPHLEAIPSGGVTADPEALRRWFDAGAVAVAMGSQLLGRELEDELDSGTLVARIAAAAAAVSAARTGT